MTMQRRFFSGDTLAQALSQAATHFQVPAAEIDYKLIEKRHGFLKVRRKVVIEVDEGQPCLDPERAATAGAAATETTGESRDNETWSEVVRAPSVDETASAAAPARESRSTRPSAGGASQRRREARAVSEEVAPTPTAAPARELAGPSADDVSHEGPESRATSWFDHEPMVDEDDDESRASLDLKSEPAESESDFESAATEPDPVRASSPEAEGDVEDDSAPSGDSEEQPERSRRSRRGRGRGRRGRRDGSRRVELAEAPPPAKARYREAQGEEAEAAKEALDRILKLAGLVVESEILQADEHLQIELRGADQDLLLRDRGRLLLAIQHLLPRAIRGLIGRSVVCKVDSDNYHDIREERLRDMAQRAADEVRDGGRPKTLEPMSPDERRIVHLTLADYPGVETESHGSGLFKRVMVRGAGGGRPQRSENYRR